MITFFKALVVFSLFSTHLFAQSEGEGGGGGPKAPVPLSYAEPELENPVTPEMRPNESNLQMFVALLLSSSGPLTVDHFLPRLSQYSPVLLSMVAGIAMMTWLPYHSESRRIREFQRRHSHLSRAMNSPVPVALVASGLVAGCAVLLAAIH